MSSQDKVFCDCEYCMHNACIVSSAINTVIHPLMTEVGASNKDVGQGCLLYGIQIAFANGASRADIIEYVDACLKLREVQPQAFEPQEVNEHERN